MFGRDGDKTGLALLFEGLGAALRDALIITAVCAPVAVAVNAWLHPEGIPFIAKQEYETLVPCPEPGGAVIPLLSSDGRIRNPETFVVDAREAGDFRAWHLDRAMNVTYDYLDPTPEEVIRELARNIARSRAQLVVVYGDGDDPDTGEQLGREISGKGIKNVFFVKGGAPALNERAGGGS